MTTNAIPTRIESVSQAKAWLKTKLLAELPLWLQKADLMIADGITTPPPRECRTCDVMTLNDYPALEIAPQDDEPVGDTFASVLQHRLMVMVTVTGDDEEKLAAWVERYVWGIRGVAKDTLMDPPDQGGPIIVGRSGYTPVADRQEGMEEPFVKGGWVELMVQTVE